MAERRVTRRRILKTAAVMGVIGAVSSPGVALADDDDGRRYRWDIHVALGCGDQTAAKANAKARDGSRISVSGSGTFRDTKKCNSSVTGGGTWSITPGASGAGGGSGTYRVTQFLDFELAPGGLPTTVTDCIGRPQDARAGLVHLKIRYSDGDEGVLVVSCRLPTTPATLAARIMEGIVASKGAVEFWNMEDPNTTIFHVLRDDDEDDEDDDGDD
jgi:hypothetical protein